MVTSKTTVTTIELAAELIRAFEGLRLITYYCPAGKRTIGYGHVLEEGSKVADQISSDIAEKLLEEDIEKKQKLFTQKLQSTLESSSRSRSAVLYL